MFKLIFNLFHIFYFVQIISSSRIFGVFPLPSLSHQVVFRALTVKLAERGHEVTVITTDPIENPPENLHQIDVHNVSYDIWKKSFTITTEQANINDALILGVRFTVTIFDAGLNNPHVEEIIQGPKEFDLILIESIFDYVYGFAHIVKAPFIGISSLPAMTQSYEAVGSPTHPLLYPVFYTQKLTDLTFIDKITNVYINFLTNGYVYKYNKNFIDNKMKTWFGSDCPSPPEIEKNVDLLIINTYPLISGVRPLVPAVVTAGGLHMKPNKPLPNDLQYYLDNSTQGVIYFSLGSNNLSRDLPKEIIELFFGVFSKLPYNILWKFENDTLPGIPDNVHIMKWFPQNDLLCHPNIKLFISQGGQQSLEEAIQCTVPLLVIPFMGDQSYNAERVKMLSIGLTVDLTELTSKDLNEKIETIIKEPRFKNSVVKLRDRINDEPESGLDRAVWWNEYLLRHGGAKHLRSNAKDVTWAEYLFLDVVAFCLVITFITVAITVVLAKVIIKRLRLFLHVQRSIIKFE